MELSHIFNSLTFGELKQVGLGGFEDHKAIQPDDYFEVVNHINMGLIQLYTKFPIQEKEQILDTEPDKTMYPLNGDVLRVTGVWSSTGCEVPVNDEYKELSVYIPSPSTIQIPYATGFEQFCITYRAAPTPIKVPTAPSELDLTQTVECPTYLVEALLAYVEYRVRKSQSGEQAVQLAMVAKQTFDALCMEIESRNILNNGDTSSCIKPALRGWV